MIRRFSGDGPEPVIEGISALLGFARSNPEVEFTFGPMELEALVRDGIQIKGSEISAPARVLTEIPGLAEVD